MNSEKTIYLLWVRFFWDPAKDSGILKISYGVLGRWQYHLNKTILTKSEYLKSYLFIIRKIFWYPTKYNEILQKYYGALGR